MDIFLHFPDCFPNLCRYVYHNVSAVVRSGLLQVVGMSNLTLYFAYRGNSHYLRMSLDLYTDVLKGTWYSE